MKVILTVERAGPACSPVEHGYPQQRSLGSPKASRSHDDLLFVEHDSAFAGNDGAVDDAGCRENAGALSGLPGSGA
jgi:hypothetical protein